ncbi:hypothetical protein BBJ28_00015802 [Nothophytophthora sp. Chile5]|nr:hypothetical protein BBJ28_00015802 [Nothophytophthora sp. Chile5]
MVFFRGLRSGDATSRITAEKAMGSEDDVAVAAAEPTPQPAPQDAQPQVEAEDKLLLHDERSCIFETRIERAERCRERGSADFKSRRVARAIEWYERALFHVDFDEGTWHFEVPILSARSFHRRLPLALNSSHDGSLCLQFTEKNRQDVNVVRLPVYLNLAACYLAQGDSEAKKDDELLAKAAANANLALAIDPDNAKALYRGGRALLLTGELDGAREKLTKAAKRRPTDRSIRDALAALKAKLAEHKQQEKEQWGGRLLTEGKQPAVEAEKQQQQRQELPRTSGSNGLWLLAVVLIALALALGQLSFVE